MQRRELELHVGILGWLFIASHLIFLLIGGFIFTLLTSVGVLAGDPEALPILSLVGSMVGGLLALLALPGIAAGYGLLARRRWGRMLALVVGILNLVNVPLGTALGAYTLYILLQEQADGLFGAPQVAVAQ
jgi:hypothetical protein